MLNIFFTDFTQELEGARQQMRDFFKGKSTMSYFPLMDWLIRLGLSTQEGQVDNLRSIFKPHKDEPWDYNIGFSKGDTRNAGRGSPGKSSPKSWKVRSPGKKDDGDEMRDPKQPSLRYPEDVDDYRVVSPAKDGKYPEDVDGYENERTGRGNETGRNVGTKQMPEPVNYPLGEYDNSPNKNFKDSDLNLLLRKKMSALIGK